MTAKANIGALIDALYKQDAVVEKARKALEAVSAKQSEMEEQVMTALRELGIDVAKGKSGGVEYTKKELPQVKDWDKVYKYVKKHDAFDLLQKRISQTAWADRAGDGPIPGVEVFVKHGLRRVKAKPKVSVSKVRNA